jgi:hypothetical protein
MSRYPYLLLSTILFNGAAIASEIECNREQTKCVTYNAQLTIGDRVGVFNNEDQVVAVGKVKTMDGDRRTVKIVKNYGTIYRKHQIALLNSNVQGIADLEASYEVYSPNALYNFGATTGIASMDVGDSLSGMEVSGYVQKRSYEALCLVLRTTFLGTTGKIARNLDYLDAGKRDMSFFGVGVLPGVAASIFEQGTVSFRGELGGGLIYSRTSLGGDTSLVEGQGFDTKVSNGIGPMLRAALSMQFKMDSYRAEIMLGQSLVYQARTSTIGIGISKDLN